MKRAVLAYAGVDEDTLFDVASGRVGISNSNLEAIRLFTYLPVHPEELVVNMDFLGAKASQSNAQGWERSSEAYFSKLYKSDPELFQGDNLARNLDEDGNFTGKGEVFVDEHWVDQYPQYEPFFGEKLIHHHIGEDGQCVAIPQSVHSYGYGVIHCQEKKMGITQNAKEYSDYVEKRVEAGEAFDAEVFQADYLREHGLQYANTSQDQISEAMEGRENALEKIDVSPELHRGDQNMYLLELDHKVSEAPDTAHAQSDECGEDTSLQATEEERLRGETMTAEDAKTPEHRQSDMREMAKGAERAEQKGKMAEVVTQTSEDEQHRSEMKLMAEGVDSPEHQQSDLQEMANGTEQAEQNGEMAKMAENTSEPEQRQNNDYSRDLSLNQ